MTDPHGNPNLLTAPADEKWKAIRKGVAVSFAFQNIKKKFPMVLERVNRVISRAGVLGPKASIDVDQLALRVTLDVIGLAGFGHDYESVEKDEPEYEHLLVRPGPPSAAGLGRGRRVDERGLGGQWEAGSGCRSPRGCSSGPAAGRAWRGRGHAAAFPDAATPC
jgi:cytochrome P450